MNSRNLKLFKDNEEKLKQALLLLLELKDSSEITVSELCQIAKINRSTFYNHYSDIYGLILSLEKNMQPKLISSLPDPEADDYLVKSIELLVNHVGKHKKFYFAFFNRTSGVALSDSLRSMWDNYFSKKLPASDTTDDEILDYSFNYVQAGIIQIIKVWLNNGCKQKQSDLTDIIYKSISYNFCD